MSTDQSTSFISAQASPGQSRPQRARLLAAALISAFALVATIGVPTPTDASAASQITGCFSYNGYLWRGLSTVIEYQTVSGGWRPLSGTNWHTGSSGCATYNITGRYQQWHLREVAFGELAAGPNRLGVFLGTSRYYSLGGAGRAYLGSRQLSLYTFPTSPSFDVQTGDWMNEMSGAGGPNCSISAAMEVACWENAHGIHGDIVVVPQDQDDDGFYDDIDRYPGNPYLR
jgi:hypothetical protein